MDQNKKLNIILTCSVQNDFIEPLDINPTSEDNLKFEYEQVSNKWMEYFINQNRDTSEANIEQFILWLKQNPSYDNISTPMSYHHILEYYKQRVHIDYNESKRLWENDKLSQFIRDLMRKASESNSNENSGVEYQLIHLRDWHDQTDESQKGELDLFGSHCIKGTYGAKFVSPLNELIQEHHDFNVIINSNSLSSFDETDLESVIETIIRNTGSSHKEVKIGVFGVITNVKVFLLTFELMIIHKFKNVYVCGDFCAGFNKQGHQTGINSLKSILAANVVDQYKFREIFGI
ncbi:MAG: isochorismatase family protein [Candidatus Lokiarchaeota archaeon]|nr:isochorismatase family protein [Candidatus Lokiarchaeota archaeon]